MDEVKVLRKRQVVLFFALLLFWLLLSSDYDSQHIITGLVLSALLTWFWRDLATFLPSQWVAGRLPGLICFVSTPMHGFGICLI
jgi:multisubunit Na+/H+ antiporter MnhE subunit